VQYSIFCTFINEFNIIYILVIYRFGKSARRLTNVAEEWHYNTTMAAWAKEKVYEMLQGFSVLRELGTKALAVVRNKSVLNYLQQKVPRILYLPSYLRTELVYRSSFK
jgi:hypothetical protein